MIDERTEQEEAELKLCWLRNSLAATESEYASLMARLRVQEQRMLKLRERIANLEKVSAR